MYRRSLFKVPRNTSFTIINFLVTIFTTTNATIKNTSKGARLEKKQTDDEKKAIKKNGRAASREQTPYNAACGPTHTIYTYISDRHSREGVDQSKVSIGQSLEQRWQRKASTRGVNRMGQPKLSIIRVDHLVLPTNHSCQPTSKRHQPTTYVHQKFQPTSHRRCNNQSYQPTQAANQPKVSTNQSRQPTQEANRPKASTHYSCQPTKPVNQNT